MRFNHGFKRLAESDSAWPGLVRSQRVMQTHAKYEFVCLDFCGVCVEGVIGEDRIRFQMIYGRTHVLNA